jgi:hypothetical protein
MSLYALERANNDLVIFLLVISGTMLLTFPAPTGCTPMDYSWPLAS